MAIGTAPRPTPVPPETEDDTSSIPLGREGKLKRFPAAGNYTVGETQAVIDSARAMIVPPPQLPTRRCGIVSCLSPLSRHLAPLPDCRTFGRQGNARPL